jgi:hypothetical protein
MDEKPKNSSTLLSSYMTLDWAHPLFKRLHLQDELNVLRRGGYSEGPIGQ